MWRPTDVRAHDARACAPICSGFLRSAGVRPYPSCDAPAPLSSLSSRLSLIAAGCGGGGSSRAATIPRARSRPTPPSTSTAIVRPEGDQRDDVLAAAGKVLRTADPQAKIDELVDEGASRRPRTRSSTTRRTSRRGWARRSPCGAPSPTGDDDFRGAVIATVEDDRGGAGGDRPRRRRRATRPSASAVRGRRLPGVVRDGAAGIVERLRRCSAPRPEFKRTIDAAKGDGLDSPTTSATSKAIDGLDDDRLGALLRRLQALHRGRRCARTPRRRSSSSRSSSCSRSTSSTRSPARSGRRRPARRSTPRSSTRRTPAASRALGSIYGAPSTPLIGELPGDSWLGARRRRTSAQTLKRALPRSWPGALGGAADRGPAAPGARARPRAATSSRWIGDIARLRPRHRHGVDLEGGLVIEVTDAATGRDGVRQARRAGPEPRRRARPPVKVDGADAAFEATPPGAPQAGRGRPHRRAVVIAYGREAAADALGGGERLGRQRDLRRRRRPCSATSSPAWCSRCRRCSRSCESTGSGRRGLRRRPSPTSRRSA